MNGVRQNRVTLLVASVVALVLLLRMVIYEVEESEVAVLLTFGEPTAEDPTPGPALKWPWPIQQVRTHDARLRVYRTPLEETITKDSQTVLVGSFVLWRISSASEFEKGLREVASAENMLLSTLRSAQKNAVGRLAFDQLVNADPALLRYAEAEQEMLAAMRREVAGRGIEVALVGIRRLGLPENVTDAVFTRMRKEREALAARVLAEGRAEAGRIRAEAEGKKTALLSLAQAEAKRTLAAAEKEIAEHYAVFEQDPELAVFLKEIEALRALMAERTTIVFDSSQAPFSLLREADVAPVDTRRDGEKK